MTSDGALVDPYNLRIGGLHPTVITQDLYAAFGKFGSITSARAMGHGFVCFEVGSKIPFFALFSGSHIR